MKPHSSWERSDFKWKDELKAQEATLTAVADSEGDFAADIVALTNALARPLFCYRLAHAMKATMDSQYRLSELASDSANQRVSGQYLSATKRMENAAHEIDAIVRAYTNGDIRA